MHKTIYKILTYLALALLLSPVVAQDAMLPFGETVGQWVHFDRAALWVLLAVALAVLVAGRGRRMPEFPAVLSLALMTWGGVEAVIGLRQLLPVQRNKIFTITQFRTAFLHFF